MLHSKVAACARGSDLGSAGAWGEIPWVPRSRSSSPCCASPSKRTVLAHNGTLSPPSLVPHSLPLRELHISGLASERALYLLSLPEELAQLATTLQRLELPRCGLWTLPDQVAALPGLTALDLSYNCITRLPDMRWAGASSCCFAVGFC